MNTLYQKVKHKEHFKKLFESWEATETIIDNNKAVWELKKPGSECCKVCLYRDRYAAFVYGDYGQYSFDALSWIASIHNFEYNNPSYLFQKLNKHSKDALYIFDEETAQKDIINWIKTQMNHHFHISTYSQNQITKFIKEYDYVSYDLNDFLEKHPSLEDIRDFLEFACELYQSTCNEKSDYISFLQNHTSIIEEYEDPYSSDLWDAGMIISQSYYVPLYALQICSKKLKRKGD
jgi:hypothetical protein